MKDQKTDAGEKLARLLTLLEPTREEILERHGGAIDAWVNACTKKKSQMPVSLVELCRGWFVRLLPNMEEFQAGIGVLSGAATFATRGGSTKGGLSETGVRGPGAEPGGHLVGKGERCFGQVVLRTQPDGRLTIELSLRDEQWNPINPFVLTVRQQSRILLDRKRIDGDRYQVSNIEPDAYQFEVTDLNGQRRVTMGWSQA